MTWKRELRTCRCGESFRPKREAQRHCSQRCRVMDAMSRYRRSDNKKPPLSRVPGSDNTAPAPHPDASEAHPGGKTGTETFKGLPIINGRINGIFDTEAEFELYQRAHHRREQVHLEYYEDGFPKIPACLDRRKAKLAEVA